MNVPHAPHNHSHHDHDHTHDHAEGQGSCCGSHDHKIPEVEPSENATHYRIEGMDCASCASTITQSLSGVSGIANPQVSLQREILSVELRDGTDGAIVEAKVKALGFGIAALNDAPSEQKIWWNTPKTKHFVASVLISILAVSATQVFSDFSNLLLTFAAGFSLFPIARRAFAAARMGAIFTIQMLMTVAACGAVIIGEQSEALLVILLFMLGEFLEGLAADKARSGIKALHKLMPNEAWLIDGEEPQKVDAQTLQVGQKVLVRTGDRVPADGEIISGQSSVDESTLTGESVPVPKSPGDLLFAGTVNHSGALQMVVSATAQNNTISRIIKMVEEAQDAKAPTERFIERFSRIYMPIIISIAIAVAVIPPLAGSGDWATWTYRALALLLIGCPCALVISVPAAIAASLSTGARNGILIKGGAVIEEIAKTQRVVFDKTGTLTTGNPQVTDVVVFNGREEQVLSLAFGLESAASHPLADAICDFARDRGISPVQFDNVQVLAGKGMESDSCFIGAPRFALELATLDSVNEKRISDLESEGKTVSLIVKDGEVLGAIALRDEPRMSAYAGLKSLKKLGIKSTMLTGDNARTAEAIGAKLGIESEANALPEDKAARVRALAGQSHVLMVGDGVNDAPALAEAQVGVAIGSGTDVALEVADAALMRNDVSDVASLVSLSRATMSNIRQNIFIALGLKVVFLATTITGLSGLWMAILADTGATVLVTLNAMRLLGALRKKAVSGGDPDQADPDFGAMDPARP